MCCKVPGSELSSQHRGVGTGLPCLWGRAWAGASSWDVQIAPGPTCKLLASLALRLVIWRFVVQRPLEWQS